MLNVLPGMVYFFLLLLGRSMKIAQVNREAVDRLWNENKSVIVCFWHGRLLAMPFASAARPAKVLISRHGDGEFIARVVSYFGLGAVRGSYRKASVSALREILSELRQGTTIGITPDGPKGPRHQVKGGIVELAKLTRTPIVPVTYGASRKKVFSSWDGFVLPYPFSRLLFVWGDPIYVAADATAEAIEENRKELEARLVAMTETADRLVCGD
jgi:lysophospholipid acyltransferase (LPLAT)-like uncharacterized protein